MLGSRVAESVITDSRCYSPGWILLYIAVLPEDETYVNFYSPVIQEFAHDVRILPLTGRPVAPVITFGSIESHLQ